MIDTALCKKGKYIEAHMKVPAMGPGTARTGNRIEMRTVPKEATTRSVPKPTVPGKLGSTKKDTNSDAITPVD